MSRNAKSEGAPEQRAFGRARRALKAGWLKFAAVLAKVNGAIVLTLIYVLIIAPINILSRIVRADLMGKRIGDEQSFWSDPEGPTRSLSESRRQF